MQYKSFQSKFEIRIVYNIISNNDSNGGTHMFKYQILT